MTEQDSTIDRVLLWMISGLAGADLENACIAKLDIDPAQVRGVISEARKRLTLAAEYNRDEMLGTALTRLNDLYGRCMRTTTTEGRPDPNVAKALDVQKEISRLAGLYRSVSFGGGESGASEASEELTAIGEYLLPLALAGETYPLREHARLAVQRITELEALTPDTRSNP